MFHQKDNCGKLALAASFAVSIIYSLCSILVAIQPKLALKIAASVHHLKTLEIIEPNVKVTVLGFIVGLVSVFVTTFILVSLTGFFYDSLTNKHKNQ